MDEKLKINSTPLYSQLLYKLGIDDAIMWVVFGRSWAIIAGPTSLLLITKNLTIDEQGYYYIFNNLISIAMFFELGLGGWILRFTSYEMNNVNILMNAVSGEQNSVSRLSSILKFSIKWFGISALIFFVIVLFFGYFYFGFDPKGQHVFWQFPLIVITAIASIDLLISPLIAFLEGSGFVDKIAKLNFFRAVIGNFVLWIALSIGLSLNSIALMSLISISFAIIYLLQWSGAFRQFYICSKGIKKDLFNYKEELLPLQIKTGITVVAGYFTWQTANLILFKLEGPGESAKLGMSINLTSMILAFGMAWINTKIPKMGTLYGAGEFSELKNLFRVSLKKVLLVVSSCSFLMIIIVYLASEYEIPLSQRILNPLDFSILLISNIFVVIQNSLAIFNRTFKREPFVYQMIVMGIAMPLVCFLIGREWGTRGIVLGIAAVNLTIGLCWSVYINYIQNKELLNEK